VERAFLVKIFSALAIISAHQGTSHICMDSRDDMLDLENTTLWAMAHKNLDKGIGTGYYIS
jgi:hypothetical protein